MTSANRKSAKKESSSSTKPGLGNSLRVGKKVRSAKPADAATSTIQPMRAKLFQNGRSQAVRLPKEFRLEGKEVQVSRHGNGVLLTPVDARSRQQYWDDYFAKLDEFRDMGPFPDCEDDTVTEPEEIFPEGW